MGVQTVLCAAAPCWPGGLKRFTLNLIEELCHIPLSFYFTPLSTASCLEKASRKRAQISIQHFLQAAHLVIEHFQLPVVLLQLRQLGQKATAEVDVDEAGWAELGHPRLLRKQAVEALCEGSKHGRKVCSVTFTPLDQVSMNRSIKHELYWTCGDAAFMRHPHMGRKQAAVAGVQNELTHGRFICISLERIFDKTHLIIHNINIQKTNSNTCTSFLLFFAYTFSFQFYCRLKIELLVINLTIE